VSWLEPKKKGRDIRSYTALGTQLTFTLSRPCDSQFDLVLQFAGKNFTLNKDDLLVPSDLAVDSTELGGEATTDCQFNAQPTDPDSDEFGPYTSITYMFGDSLLRNVAMVRG
jgi:hypothetical protein